MKNSTFKIFLSVFVLAILVVASTGCGESVDVFECSGTITYDGEPMPEVFICFEPEDGVDQPVSRAESDATWSVGADLGSLHLPKGISRKIRPQPKYSPAGTAPSLYARDRFSRAAKTPQEGRCGSSSFSHG